MTSIAPTISPAPPPRGPLERFLRLFTDVRDGDVGVIMAVGFPAFTGGPFTYIDNYGVEAFVRDADELASRYGGRFTPPKLLRDMAAEGTRN